MCYTWVIIFMKHRASFIVPVVVGVMAICMTAWMWYYKIQLGMHRYFDIDELAYLYWATHMHMGLKPYVDFLFYTAPGFYAMLVPIVALTKGIAVFAAARGAMLIVLALLSIALMSLFWELRRTWIVVFIPLLLVFLPMPSDKFIEIRPDTLAMTLFIFGLWLQMRLMNGKKNTSFVAGLLYGASIAVSQKMFLSVGIALLGGSLLVVQEKQSWRVIKEVIVGICIAGLVTVVYLLSLGNFSMVWYCLTTYAFEASSLGKLFPIPPQFYFLQNDVLYGTGGYHIGYIANLLLWIVGFCVACVRLFTLRTAFGKKRMWQEVIVVTLFLSSIFLYIFVLPMKHAQYLIPPALFVVFYVVDWIWEVWKHAKHTAIGQFMFLFGCGILFFFFWKGYSLVTMPKLYWTNEGDIQKAQAIWNTISLSEPIFDMTGLTMRYPQPYFAPMLPIGQLAPIISFHLPSLSSSLESTDTKFIYSSPSERFATLSYKDQVYIMERFTQVGDRTLWVRNDIVASHDWLKYGITNQQ